MRAGGAAHLRSPVAPSTGDLLFSHEPAERLIYVVQPLRRLGTSCVHAYFYDAEKVELSSRVKQMQFQLTTKSCSTSTRSRR